jgi:predicted nuclease of predicted toxin-antitoxin system
MAAAAFGPVAELVHVGDIASGAPDEDVLALARREDRILVTEDYDFGRLIFGERAPPPPGLIHLALAGMTSAERTTKLSQEAAALVRAAPNRFVVFSKGPVRSRPFP